ncbi:hypothetical protein Glove_368g25 [Diversispora epigaea]|uniref:DUF659 domain-containing protein n=1 Tax=Diversispora epigaea TaxID=1348612 RepID=A0A397HBJ7_9GLOM|nr:hypothetical protein Glove_368g25 [Diversispora epigaea]
MYNLDTKIQQNILFSSQALSSSAQISLSSAQVSLSSVQASLFSAQAIHVPKIDFGFLSIDRKKFNLLILCVTISCKFALSWVNNPEVIELFKFLNLLIKLPDRKILSNKILHKAVTDFNNIMIEKLESDKIGIILSFDGWINVYEQELMGTIIMSSNGQLYIWKAMDISDKRHKTDDIIAKTEEIITDIKELNLTILAIVTDSVLAYNAVSEIFKISLEFKTTSSYVLKIAAYFKNTNNKYFIRQLRTIQKEIYGKYIQPIISDKIRLYEVLHGFAYLTQFWKKYVDNDMTNRILMYLQKRWESWKQKMVRKNYLFDNETICQFENNIYKYWCWIKGAYSEIRTVASRIFDVDSETESLIEENKEVSNNSEDDKNNNIDIEDIFQKFNDHLSEWIGILETETENLEFLKNEIENINHPAVNIQAKWNLDIILYVLPKSQIIWDLERQNAQITSIWDLGFGILAKNTNYNLGFGILAFGISAFEF